MGRWRRRRDERDRGSVLIEAAIITPVFLLMVFGVVEWGYAFLDRLTVENSSLVGARVASSEGANTLADYDILQAVKVASGAMKSGQVQLVIVYNAGSQSGTVPSSCKTASVASTCNRYTGADFTDPSTSFGCGTGALDTSWCPTTRKDRLTGSSGPPDYIGVYVQGLHTNATGYFGRSYTFTSDTVIRIEPTKKS